MAITSSGIGSGLDIENLVTQLVAAERSPTENRLVKASAEYQGQISAFGALKGAMSSFQSSLSALQSLSTYSGRNATVSDADVLSVSAGSAAVAGSYSVEVSALAKAHSLASGSYTATTDVVGEGTLSFRFGTTDYTSPDPGPEAYNGFTLNADKAAATVTIDSTNNTLEGIRDAVNDADIGVNASIINDGSGFRLLFSSEDTGAENSLEIAVAESGAAGLSAFEFSASATNLSQTVVAQDASLTVNGLPVTSASNKVSGVINGLDLSLKSTTSGVPVEVGVARNSASITGAVNSFIAAYNGMIETTNALSSYDPATKEAGLLLGDATLRGVSSSLRRELNTAISGIGPYDTLASVGITTDSDGKLALNQANLDEVLEQDFDALSALFAAQGVASASGVNYISSSSKTAIGDYALEISQLATQGENSATASAGFLASMVIDGLNDSFKLKVNGVESAEITLTQATYANGDALAEELQTKINGDATLKAGGLTVAVTFDSGTGAFAITSQRYGADSTVELTSVDSDTATTLGFSVSAGTDGLDVEGTIGGVSATGVGQRLTAATGSDAEGLALLISATTAGSLGSVNFTRGLADGLDNLLDNFLGADNILEVRLDGLQDRIDQLDEDGRVLDRRMEAIETRYRLQFGNLDALLSTLNNTGNFLTTQLANLPTFFGKNK
ncbi:MAG: flagellar filament capping protein FliD [Gammaproteobacteria bacterium]|nr:flagellar filament capping protein FliD [Gammaproteobacteria bacterium]MBQ0839517.1 flagellar filament capping protein FliD [Gammaproteobacteria bacterium]